MKLCEAAGCENWAQWRLKYKDETTRLLCTVDKDKEVGMLPEELQPKVNFLGAVPR